MEVRRLDPSDLEALDLLIRAYEFKPFRRHRLLSRKRQDAVLKAEIELTLKNPGGRVLLASHGNDVAAISFRQLPWDSTFFGIPMGRIDYLLRSSEDAHAPIDAVVEACLDVSRTAGIRHLSARADVADIQAIDSLESHGFRLKDALVTYMYHPKRKPLVPVREMGVLRPFRPDDADQVVEIARDAFRGFKSRFHMDRHLPSERADELYVEWARRCCSGQMADAIFVTENGQGQLHGFMAFRRLEPVSSVGGAPIFGGGLVACRPTARAAHTGLIRAGCMWAKSQGALAEAQTLNHNHPVIRVYETLGGEYVRAEYTFHAWLGD